MAEANWAFGLTQGLAAAAQSGVGSIDRAQKEEADNRAANRDLDIKVRLIAAEEAMRNRADDRKRALAVQEGQAINTGATGLLNSGVATKINSTFGSEIDPNNPDSAATLQAIRNNPDAAKAYGLQPEDDLTKAKARAEAARNQGNVTAAGEEDKNVRNLVQDKRNKDTDASTNKRLDNEVEWRKTQADLQNRQADRQQTLAEATLAHQRRQEGSADARAKALDATSMRNSISTLLTGVNNDIKNLEKEAGSIDTDPGKKAVIDKQLVSMRAEAQRYRSALADKVGVEGAPEPTSATPPAKAIEYLKANPGTAAQFEAKYGPGSAATHLKASAPAPAPAAAAGPSGLLASQGPPTKDEAIGQQLDAAKKALASVGSAPGQAQEAKAPGSVAAWRKNRDELAAKVQALQQQYEQAVSGGNTGAYFGGRGGA